MTEVRDHTRLHLWYLHVSAATCKIDLLHDFGSRRVHYRNVSYRNMSCHQADNSILTQGRPSGSTSV